MLSLTTHKEEEEEEDPSKATGPDQIPGKLLKICASLLADVFAILFQASLDQGVVLDEWKLGIIMPLFKKSDKSNVENYRPISVTSIACELFEHIIHSMIMDYLDANRILTDYHMVSVRDGVANPKLSRQLAI